MIVVGDKQYTAEEFTEVLAREGEERWQRTKAEHEARQEEREEAGRLLRKLGAAYTEYTHFVAAHPEAAPAAEADPADQAFYDKLRRNLGHADDAPRCTHIKADGIRCGSPRMKTGLLCYSHQRMTEAHPGWFRMAAIEDANGIQLALMQVCRALIDGDLTHALAGKLLYALQTAASNVERVTFHENPGDMVVEAPESAPEPAPSMPEPPPSHGIVPYELIDDDLMRQLSAIGDELDRRARVRAGHESPTVAPVVAPVLPPILNAEHVAPYIGPPYIEPKPEAPGALAIGPTSSGNALAAIPRPEAPADEENEPEPADQEPISDSQGPGASSQRLPAACKNSP